jgi:hypothetical protein
MHPRMTSQFRESRDDVPRMIDIANDGLRFILELIALGAVGYWGWQQGDGATRWGLAIVLPLALATISDVFRVPGDPKDAPVAVSGVVRLAIEATIFTLAVLALRDAASGRLATSLALVLILHYALDWERLRWLLRQ